MFNGLNSQRAVDVRSAVDRLPALLWIVTAFLGLVGSAWAADARDSATMHTIVFFGDSLTAGYGLENPAAEAYPALIQKKLNAERLPWRIVNAGVSGETSAGGLRRIDWVLRQRIDVFFLALGANDGLRGISPVVTRANLQQIIARVRAKYPQAKIVVAGMEMPPSLGQIYTQEYRAVFSDVAKASDATLLPFLIEGVAGRADLNQADAVHPTAAGYRIVAENVWKTLRPLL